MKWLEKEIVDLTDEELIDAYSKLLVMLQNYEAAKLDPRYIKKFRGQPIPQINPAFTALRSEVAAELAKREIVP